MTIPTLQEELRKLSAKDRAELLMGFMPEFCRTVMANPTLRHKMMSRCWEMMQAPEARGFMPPMMEQMMKNMMGD